MLHWTVRGESWGVDPHEPNCSSFDADSYASYRICSKIYSLSYSQKFILGPILTGSILTGVGQKYEQGLSLSIKTDSHTKNGGNLSVTFRVIRGDVT